MSKKTKSNDRILAKFKHWYILLSYQYNWFVIFNQSDHTHVKKVGHTSEFPFGIYWWTLKNPKNQNFEKIKKKKTFYTCVPETTMYKVQFLRYRVRQISSHYESFFTLPPPPLTTQKTKILKKKKKKKPGDIIIL